MEKIKDPVLKTGKRARLLIMGVVCVIIVQIIASLVISSLMVQRIETTRVDELRKSWDNFLDQKFKEVFNYVLGYSLWTELNISIKNSNGIITQEQKKTWLSQNETQNDICAIIRYGKVIVSGGKEFEKLEFLLGDPVIKKVYQQTNKTPKSELKRYVLNYPAMTLLLIASPLYDDNGEVIITEGINIFGRIVENNFDVASSFLNSTLKMENKNITNPKGFVIEIKDTFNAKNIRYLSVTPKLRIGNLVFYPLSAITGMQIVIVVFIILTFLLLLKGITALTIELRKTRDALWSEMELAQKIQTCLLPQDPHDQKYNIAATMIPAAEVGGDYYDFITGGDGRRWIAIGDVSGHGVSAGLIMMMAQSVVTALITNKPDISTIEVVSHLNTVLYQNIRERMKLVDYLTFSILVENKPGVFAYAGMHETILVYRIASRGCEEIPTTGPWVGMMKNVQQHLKEGTFNLQKGDTLVLYTDGVIEAANAENKQFDLHGLKQSIERNAQLPAAEIVSTVVNDVRNWLKEQKDDITLLVLKYL